MWSGSLFRASPRKAVGVNAWAALLGPERPPSGCTLAAPSMLQVLAVSKTRWLGFFMSQTMPKNDSKLKA
jgi:hypothetical protein